MRAVVADVSPYFETLTFAIIATTRPYSAHLPPGRGVGYQLDLWSPRLLLTRDCRQIARLLVMLFGGLLYYLQRCTFAQEADGWDGAD